MARTLRALRLHLDPPNRAPSWQTVVRPSGNMVEPVPKGRRFCDLTSGDFVTNAGVRHRVIAVMIEDADPPEQKGRIVTSGRAWLAGE